jgi:hypothetical protein
MRLRQLNLIQSQLNLQQSQRLNPLVLVAEKEVAQPFQILAVAGDQIKKRLCSDKQKP